MWQRIQTVYLFLALVLTVVCLCLPVAIFHVSELGEYVTMTNLFMVNGNGSSDMSVWPMFAVLLLTCPIAVFAIFLYKKRMLQARLCVINILLILIWMALCAYYVYTTQAREEFCHLSMSFTAALPAISLILYILARRGIIKDEKLVRAADRIR